MNKRIEIFRRIEVNDLEKLDIECEEYKIYSNNAEDAKLSADILDERED